jgi:hypothetical protein
MITASVEIGQQRVIHAHQVEDGRVQVMDVDLVLRPAALTRGSTRSDRRGLSNDKPPAQPLNTSRRWFGLPEQMDFGPFPGTGPKFMAWLSAQVQN